MVWKDFGLKVDKVVFDKLKSYKKCDIGLSDKFKGLLLLKGKFNSKKNKVCVVVVKFVVKGKGKGGVKGLGVGGDVCLKCCF